MNNAYAASIASAQRYLQFSTDPSHGFSHAQRVVANAALISTAVGYPDADLIAVCAWWHDVGRLVDPDHEELSGILAYFDLRGRGVAEPVCETVHHAVRLHRWDMRPNSIEGKILRDADKLDFLSWERWEEGMRAGQWQSVRTKQQLLPRLRGLLELEAARAIYDQRIVAFRPHLQRAGLALSPAF